MERKEGTAVVEEKKEKGKRGDTRHRVQMPGYEAFIECVKIEGNNLNSVIEGAGMESISQVDRIMALMQQSVIMIHKAEGLGTQTKAECEVMMFPEGERKTIKVLRLLEGAMKGQYKITNPEVISGWIGWGKAVVNPIMM